MHGRPLPAIVFHVPNVEIAPVCHQVAVLVGAGLLPWAHRATFYIQCPSPAA